MGRILDAVRSGITREKARRQPKRNRNEREFQAAAIEILETPASPVARIFSALTMAFVVAALLWSWFDRVDTHATMQGKIIPIGKVQVIEPLVTGTVKAIHVKTGDHVDQGAVLVELDSTEYAAEREKLAGELAVWELTVARLKATIDAAERGIDPVAARFDPPENAPPAAASLQLLQMRQSLAALRSGQASLQAEIVQNRVAVSHGEKNLVELRKLVSLTGDRSSIFRELERRGVGIKSSTIDARQSEQDQVVALQAESGRIAELSAAVATLEARKTEQREAFLDKLFSELIAAESRVGILRKDLAKAELYERAGVLRSPASGRVQQLQVNTIGEVAQAGQQMMVIVPDGTRLEVEAMLLNKDRGFVREGQDVRIKLEAFPFTRYGTLSGEVMTVSTDAVPFDASRGAASDIAQSTAGALVFPIRISLEETTITADGDSVALNPGMSVTAEVKTGDRRVIEFLLEPLIRMQDEALHER